MPGAAACRLAALLQVIAFHARLGRVIERRETHDAAADNDNRRFICLWLCGAGHLGYALNNFGVLSGFRHGIVAVMVCRSAVKFPVGPAYHSLDMG